MSRWPVTNPWPAKSKTSSERGVRPRSSGQSDPAGEASAGPVYRIATTETFEDPQSQAETPCFPMAFTMTASAPHWQAAAFTLFMAPETDLSL